MKTQLKKIAYGVVLIASICVISYGAYVLYDVVMLDVAERIKTAVTEGIQEGLLNTVNPLNWPQALIERYAQ